MALVIAIGLFISLSILIESLGVWLRFAGAVRGEAASGYSSHVRIATLGRFFILMAAPLLGYHVDQGASPKTIASIGIITFSLVLGYLFVDRAFKRKKYIDFTYNVLNTGRGLKKATTALDEGCQLQVGIAAFSCFAFSLTASGLIFVNYLAASFPENRAMIVQMSPFITMLGTLAHVFLLDPKLAYACDTDIQRAACVVRSYLFGRLVASGLLVVTFSCFYFFSVS